MEDCVIFYDEKLPIECFTKFEELRQLNELCDVTLKVGHRNFPAHRVVLAATIPYFHVMFTSNMIESKTSEITINDIDHEAFATLMDFAYKRTMRINFTNVESLLVCSSFLQWDQVRDACCTFLERRLKPHNVLGVRKLADALSCLALVQAADYFLRKHFVEVSRSEEFLFLPFSDVKEIIARDDLCVPSEEQVFTAMMHWIKKDMYNRKELVAELLSNVRLHLLSPEFLVLHVGTEQIIRNSEKCRDILSEIASYHMTSSGEQLSLQNLTVKARSCPDDVGFIYVVDSSAKKMEIYDPKTSQWQVVEYPSVGRTCVTVAVMKNKLYVIGGYSDDILDTQELDTVEVFDPLTQLWSIASPMKFKRGNAGVAVSSNKLYVCGGLVGSTAQNMVECYDPEKNKWTTVTNMQQSRFDAGVVSLDDYIYVIGGYDNETVFNSVEQYDLRSKKWRFAPAMLTERHSFGAATLKGKIYACGGTDVSTFETLQSAEVYDPATKMWSSIRPMNVKRHEFPLVSNCGLLYAIGGYDGSNFLNSVEVYYPVEDEWRFISSMKELEGCVAAGVIYWH